MTYEEARSAITGLNPALTRGEFDLLMEDGYWGEYAAGVITAEQIAQRTLRIRRSRTPNDEERDRPATRSPDDLLRFASTRAEAVSSIMASEAERDPAVIRYREVWLPNGLLSHEDVEAWLEARLKTGDPIFHVTFAVNSSDELPADSEPVHHSRPYVQYAVPDGEWVMSVPSSTDLEPLRHLTESLSSRYGWQPAQATIFVLTGKVPILPPARTKVTLRMPVAAASRIVLDLDPTLTPNEVAHIYSKRRTRSKRMSEKHLRLAIFADRHSDGTWNERMKLWNEEFPEYRYREWRNFQRDATRAVRRLMFPPVA